MGRRFVVDKLGIMWRRKRERGSGIIPENLFRLSCEKGGRRAENPSSDLTEGTWCSLLKRTRGNSSYWIYWN